MNEFEKYPPLAKRMEELANTNIVGWSMQDWDEFCTALNEALFNAWTAGGKYGWKPDSGGCISTGGHQGAAPLPLGGQHYIHPKE